MQFDPDLDIRIAVTYSPRFFPKIAENLTDGDFRQLTPQDMVELESISSDDAANGERYMDGFPSYLRSDTPPLSSWIAYLSVVLSSQRALSL
ncbi:Aldo/keto reductase [Artemisia annua]|uniref:Aldo/keto reductase n=1 Tax=Artemisia annua TaxID=35608 RepID=A0A2U1KAP4_ARTAN|nr:Aldo/keto reductase [Artemisia annua]